MSKKEMRDEDLAGMGPEEVKAYYDRMRREIMPEMLYKGAIITGPLPMREFLEKQGLLPALADDEAPAGRKSAQS